MRKMITALAVLIGTSNFVYGQSTGPVKNEDPLRTEAKAALISKLGVSEEASVKILDVEENFYAKLASIEGMSSLPVTEKETKRNELHTTRRAALLAIPLTGRQMEDAVEVVAFLRYKLKR